MVPPHFVSTNFWHIVTVHTLTLISILTKNTRLWHTRGWRCVHVLTSFTSSLSTHLQSVENVQRCRIQFRFCVGPSVSITGSNTFIQTDISYKPLRRIAMKFCTDTNDSQIRKLIEFDEPTSRWKSPFIQWNFSTFTGWIGTFGSDFHGPQMMILFILWLFIQHHHQNLKISKFVQDLWPNTPLKVMTLPLVLISKC